MDANGQRHGQANPGGLHQQGDRLEGMPHDEGVLGVAAGLLVERLGDILTSPDAITWTCRLGRTGESITAMSRGNGEFVAFKISGTVLGSTDGLTWTPRVTSGFINARAYGDGHFVGVGGSGAILQSGEIITLKPAARSPAGAVHLAVTGQAGHDYLIQSSTNLADWLTVTTLTMTNESVQFSDRTTNGSERRFYRAV